jgi:hypothetical protein
MGLHPPPTDKMLVPNDNIPLYNIHYVGKRVTFRMQTNYCVSSKPTNPHYPHTYTDIVCLHPKCPPLPLQISRAKQSGPSLSKIISRNCCNLSFISSEIPKDWKVATVIPLFKGGDKTATGLQYIYPPCLSKVLESQVNKHITDHLESHRTFSAMQSGFRAGYGCPSATLKVLNDIITSVNKRQYCEAVFIDLAKAFDSPHSYRQTQQPWFLK